MMVCNRYQTTVKRKRNSTQASVTQHAKKPDLLWLVGGTLLFKGEVKTSDNDMGVALMELLSKMKDWSSNYHGQVCTQLVQHSLRCHACIKQCATQCSAGIG